MKGFSYITYSPDKFTKINTSSENYSRYITDSMSHLRFFYPVTISTNQPMISSDAESIFTESGQGHPWLKTS